MLDQQTEDVKPNGLDQPLAASLQETDNNIPANEELDETGVPIKNREEEAARKLNKKDEEIKFLRGHIEQQNAVMQQSFNRQQQVTQQSSQTPKLEDNPILKVTDRQLEEYASISEENAIAAEDIRQQREIAKEEIRYAKFKERALHDPDFKQISSTTKDYEAEVKQKFPELNDYNSPAFQATRVEYQRLIRLGATGGEVMLEAAENAKLRNPNLFARNVNVDNRNRMVNQHMQNNLIPAGGNKEQSLDTDNLTKEDIAMAKLFGNDPKALSKIKKQMVIV